MARRKVGYKWNFFRAGGVDQVDLRSGEDVKHIPELDQKLWVALACPTRGLHIDARTLDLVDTDKDGRIRPPEIIGAIAWATEVFKNLDDLFLGGESLPLASIDDATAAGGKLLAGARRVLANLGEKDATAITLEHVANTEKIFAETKFNGDGIVPSDSADDPATQSAIEAIIGAVGSSPDRSKKPGVDQAKVDAFFTRAVAWADWYELSKTDASILALGEGTAAAVAALAAVSAKIDDYFVRCRLGAFDTLIGNQLATAEGALVDFGGRELAPEDAVAARLPLARPEPGRALPLLDGLNPAWAGRIATFVGQTVPAVLGSARSAMTEREWTTIKERLAPYRAWQASKPADAALEKLGDAVVVDLARGGARQAVTDLIARDAALAPESDEVEAVEKMIRLRRDFVTLLRNFVNFAQFYGTRLAAFQIGTLYLDGRSCDLCLPVADVGRHALLAGRANAYLAYCECTRKRDAEKQTIVAAVTGGDVDNIMVGRNGVFYDRKGDDWDATITKVVENPISVAQAFWSPYKRFIRLIEEQVAKRASAADDEANKSLQTQAAATATADQAKAKAPAPAAPPAAPVPAEKKIDVGTVAAIGVAVGGIATFFSSILATFFGLGMWMPAGLLALVLAISGPSMIIAWLKLRRRNIGPILDANSWAVNAFARINVPFGGALTEVASLPPGASRSLEDPFAEKRSPWKTYLFLFLVLGLGIAWYFGALDKHLPPKAQSATILH